MPPTGRSISYALALNAGRMCNVKGCECARVKLSKHCRRHDDRRRHWGSVHGKAWSIQDMKGYLPTAESFLQINSDHPAIVAAERWLRESLEDSAEVLARNIVSGMTTRGMAAIHAARATPHEVLARVIAATLYMMDQEPAQRELAIFQRNLGFFVLNLVRPSIARGGRARQFNLAVGGFVWGALHKVLAGVMAHQRQFCQAQSELEHAAKQPFRTRL